MRKFFCACGGCNRLIVKHWLIEHWLRNHYSEMYIQVELQGQTVLGQNDSVVIYRCLKCKQLIHQLNLGSHWKNKHFEIMFRIVDLETQETFTFNTETKELKSIIHFEVEK